MESLLTTVSLSLMDVGMPVQAPLVLLAVLLLLRGAWSIRMSLRTTLLLYGFSILMILISAALHSSGWTGGAGSTRNIGVLLMGLALIRLTGQAVFHLLLPRLNITPPRILEDVLVFIAYLLWGFIRLSQIGLDLSSIVTTSAVITGVLAFSLQETIGNILGGVTLQMDDSIRVGDWIQVGELVGRIVDIRWRSTAVETRNWETVIFPNSLLTKREFSILGRRTGEPIQWRRWIWFSVGLDTSPRRVTRVIEEALRKANVRHVASRPAPDCITMDINDSVVRYAVRYWLTDLAVDDPTDSAIRSRVYAALKRAGIRLALPGQQLHIVSEDEHQEARQRLQNIEQRVALLRGVGLFRSLDEDELQKLAGNLLYTPFVADDVVTAQGATAHWLYILVDGAVEVVLDSGSGRRRTLARLEAGHRDSYFGEMGLLTGAPRTASVIAVTDVECYRLSRDGFEEVLTARPAIAEEISTIIAERRADLAVAQNQLDEAAHEAMSKTEQREILQRIRRFFSLKG